MRTRWMAIWVSAIGLFLLDTLALGEGPGYPWPKSEMHDSLENRIPPPPGFQRISDAKGSFASWLRNLPLREPETVVRLFDGREKSYQGGVFAVIDIDVGPTDLQQCADAVIRLRAEYLWASGCADRIAFNFTSGHRARWFDWSTGQRPVVSGNRVSWVRRNEPAFSYRCFREYLNCVFTYAGSYSLARELDVVADPSGVQPGDVFVQGGFPGHAVLVADVAENAQGEKVFLLAQSYMPAQDIHVLVNSANRDSPWYTARAEGTLETPEWTFSYSDLRRFPEVDCRIERHDIVLPKEKE